MKPGWDAGTEKGQYKQKELAEAKLISENQLVGDFSAQLCETVRDDWEEVMRPQGTGQLSEND